MLFTDPVFLFYFLPLAFLVHCLALRLSKGYGIAARLTLFALTLVFYGYREPWWLLPFLVCVGFDLFWAWAIHRASERRTRRLVISLAVAQNLALLAAFKYRSWLGVSEAFTIGWALPVGISFYTFESLSYLIDVYRRDLKPAPVSQYLAFIGMFPRFSAGPIVRYRQLETQFVDYRGMQLERGLSLFILGLFFKIAFGDSFSLLVPFAFDHPAPLVFAPAWMGVMAYAMQLYFDFYGYSLMATGLGLCFGFEFPDNFDKPYHAISVQSFWNRWHVSLGQWIRLYVFLPLATRWRKKPYGISAAIFLTLVLIGLWHGPKINYLWMGAWFGAWMVLEHRFPLPERWRHRIGWPLTAFAVLFGWVLLRASDMNEAWRVLRALASFSSFSFTDASVAAPSPLALCLCAMGLAYVLVVEKALDLRKVVDATSWTKAIAGAVLAVLSLLLAYSEPTIPFLYFAF